MRTHPSEEALAALLEDGIGEAPDQPGAVATRRHVAGCPPCTRHLAELRALRHVLQDEAAREATPPHDLARAALERLRLRQATAGRLNELLMVLVGFIRGFATLLAEPGAARTSAVSAVPQPPPDVTGAAGAAGAAGATGGAHG